MTDKYKRFWIEEGSFIYACHERKEHLNGWRANGEGPWQVIETKAVDDLQAKLDEAVLLIQGLKRHIDMANKLGMGNGELSNKIDDFLKGLGEG